VKEGFWLNYKTRHFIELVCTGVDHEAAIRSPGSQKWLGVPAAVVRTFERYSIRTERDAFLTHVLKTLPLMRIRGHLTDITVEFWSKDLTNPFIAIGKWAGRFAAPTMSLNVVNLSTGENWQVIAGEWAAFVKNRENTHKRGVVV
jgi:hypothetical protein